MAGNSVTIEAKLEESKVVAGAKRIKASLEDIKKADDSLDWDGVKEGESAAKGSGDGFTVLKGVLANLATAGIAIATNAVKDFCASIVEIGQTFETSMSKVSALSGATGDDLAALEAKARELGASTTFSASQAADALGYMALAGWDTQQMLDGVGSVLTLAQAGELDLAAASDLVTDYLSAFNMEAAETARMADVLAYAQANANTTVEGLGMAFKNCAANANAAGMDVETTSAAISMMANQGLKGSEAGTALNAVLRDMTAKMEDGAIAIGDQSIAIMDAQGNYRDFAEILADVEAATDGMGEAEKAAALQSTFTADSIKGLNLLLNAGADEMSGFRDELYGCAGTAEETAAIMTDNLGGDLAAMNSALEELSLKIYDCLQESLRGAVQFVTGSAVPAIEGLLAWLTTGAQEFDEFGNVVGEGASPLQRLAGVLQVVALAITAVCGGLLAYKAYSLGVAAAEKARTVATLAVNTATALLNGTMAVNPIGIVITLIGALVAAFAYLWATSEEFRGFWIGLWEYVKAGVQPVADWVMANVVAPLTGYFQNFQEALSGIWDAVVARVMAAWSQIAPIVEAGARIVQSVISAAMGVIQAVWSGCWGVVSAIAEAVWNSIANVVETALGVIQGIIQVVTGLISGDWNAVWSGMAKIFSSIVNGILQAAANTLNALTSTVSAILTGIYNVWASIWNGIFGVVGSVWKAITSTVLGTARSIQSGVAGTFNSLWNSVSSIFRSVRDAMCNPIETAKKTIQGIVNTIKGFFTNFHVSLPHINLPHFSISPAGWQVGDLLKGTIPTLGISWYATGGMFNGPSVIGVGEAGPEAVLPLSNRQAMRNVGEAISEAGGASDTSGIVDELRAIRRDLPRMMAAYCMRSLVVNEREFARLVKDTEGRI